MVVTWPAMSSSGNGPLIQKRVALPRALEGNYRDHHVAYSVRAAYGQLGDMAKAGQWLRAAADTGFACVPFFERDPPLEPVRQTSGFQNPVSYVRQRREASFSESAR